jgi:hypothetical protein
MSDGVLLAVPKTLNNQCHMGISAEGSLHKQLCVMSKIIFYYLFQSQYKQFKLFSLAKFIQFLILE